MFIVFILLLVICSVSAVYFIKEGYAEAGAGTSIAALLLFFAVITVHYNNVQVGKVEALKSAGIEPLTQQQVYNMSKKELDECNVLHTFSNVYYFNTRDKE